MSSSEQEKVDGSDSAWQKIVPKLKFPTTKAEKDELYGAALVRDFRNVFETRLWNSPNFDSLVLHIVAGQLPSMLKTRLVVGGNKLDLRIHGTLLQPSGTGKGRGFDMANELCQNMSLKYQPVTELTDAALLGSWEKLKVHVPKVGEKIETTLIPGWLHQSQGINIIAMSEAEPLFSPKVSQYARNTMTYYQTTMNTLGSADNLLVKRLGSVAEPIECRPTCSILLTSYPPDNLLETIVKRGFMQRQLLVINQVTLEDRIHNVDKSIDGLGIDTDYEYVIPDIADRLKIVNKHISDKPYINVTKDARRAMKAVKDDLFSPLDDISIYPRKKLEEFIHRYIEHNYKLSAHHMFFRLDNNMLVEDVAYAKNFVIPVWTKIVAYIEDSLHEEGIDRKKRVEEYKVMHECYKIAVSKKYSKGWVPVPVLVAATKMEWDVSKPTAVERIRKAIEAGMFIKKMKNVTAWVKFVKVPKR